MLELSLPELLLLLVFGHFVCDYVLQTEAIAVGKNRFKDKCHFGVPWYYWMVSHGSIHALSVFLVTESTVLALCECFVHMVVDDLKCAGVLDIHKDQAIHIACKVLWVACAL